MNSRISFTYFVPIILLKDNRVREVYRQHRYNLVAYDTLLVNAVYVYFLFKVSFKQSFYTTNNVSVIVFALQNTIW